MKKASSNDPGPKQSKTGQTASPRRASALPVALMGYLVIVLTFGVFGGWAAFAKLDSAVVAPGTLSLEGNRKVVQHLEGGIVEAIYVEEGDLVGDGDILIRLRSVEARSNLDVLTRRLNIARVVEARLIAERTLADRVEFPADLLARLDDAEVEAVIADQRRLFDDRRAILESQRNILAKRISQSNVQIEGLELQKSSFERRITNFTEMIERMREGQKGGFIQTNLLSQREDELIQIEADLGQVISDTAEVRNVIGETELEMLKLEQEFRGRASGDLEDVREDISELTERIKVARDVLVRTEIRAPGSGTIQNLKVHTIGSVVSPGNVLMELVPLDEQLIVNARVSPIDIENVGPGLETEVRFTAFNGRLNPIMLGEVETVSQDVITPDRPNEAPYFLARVRVNEEEVPDDMRARMTAGMPADIIIKLGERTVLNYLTAPLANAIRKSMTEE